LGPRISITALIFWLLFDQAKSNKGVPTAMAWRWQWWPKFQEGNKLVRRYAEEERNLRFIDLSPGMLDSTLHPHRHIWMSDSLHMNEAGYKVWVDLLKPYLAQEWAEVQGQ
jgi:hypothetical protein